VLLKTSGNSTDFTVTASPGWLSVQPSSGTITPARPQTLAVYVDPLRVPAGPHSGSIVISGGGGSVAVQVTVAVAGAGGEVGTGGGLTASPLSVTMRSAPASAVVVREQVVLSSDGALPFTAFPTTASGGDWLNVTQGRGSAPTTLYIQATARALLEGSYSGTVVVSTARGVLLIPVTLDVGTASPGNVHVSPASLDVSGSSDCTGLWVRSLYVTNPTGQPTAFTAEIPLGADWISISQTSGITPATIDVTVDLSKTTNGVSAAPITIVASDGFRQRVWATTRLNSPGWVPGPYSMEFTAAAGGTAPAQKLMAIRYDLTPFVFSAWTSVSTENSWLSVTPDSTVSPGPVSVSASASGLSPGTYEGRILCLQDVFGFSLPVMFTVTPTANVTVAPESLAFEAAAGATSIPARTLDIGISVGRVSFTVATVTSSGGDWLQVTPASGLTPGKVTVAANPAGLVAGTYSGTVIVDVAGATNSPRKVVVTLTITPGPPVITAVLNAAAGTSGFLSAGTIGSIYGRALGPEAAVFPRVSEGGLAPGQVGQVRVLIDDIPAVVLYAQSRQINFVVPWLLAGRTVVHAEVEYESRRSAPVQIQLYEASPAIFSLDGSGLGQGAILNQDGSVNGTGNPGEGGAVVMIFATGMGRTEPESADGAIPVETLPRPVLPVSVLVGATEAEVLYAGAAPYLVSGTMQVNARIPRNLLPGSYALTLRVGRFSSRSGITIAVK